MSCGARNGYNDVCGETYTCPTCMMGDAVDSLRARIAELERALKRLSESLNVIVAWSGDCYCLTDYEAGIAGGKECPTCAAIEGLSEIKSVLGKGE